MVFSHHGEFDRLLLDVLGDEVLHHDRSSWVAPANATSAVPHRAASSLAVASDSPSTRKNPAVTKNRNGPW